MRRRAVLYKRQCKAARMQTFRFKLYEDLEVNISKALEVCVVSTSSYPTGVREVLWICSTALSFLKDWSSAPFEFAFEPLVLTHMVATTEGSAV